MLQAHSSDNPLFQFLCSKSMMAVRCHGHDTTTGNCIYINLCHISWNLFSQVELVH